MKNTVIPECIISKAIAALDLWACHFKVIGSRDETPRYAQLMVDDNGVFALRSTQKKLFYDLHLTDAENEFLTHMDFQKRWNTWKEIRTAYLLENHPTISVY